PRHASALRGDRYPRPLLGRAGHRVQDARAVHGVRQGRAVRHALGDGAQEAVRLDHLEVVVAHGVRRARLERGELAVARAHMDGADRLVLVGGAAADTQLVHPAEVPEHGAPGAVHLEAVVVLFADGDPARLQDAPRTGGEAEQAADVVLVLHRPELTARGPGVTGRRPGR